jgi:capsular polysaccharide biosynthesis protein
LALAQSDANAADTLKSLQEKYSPLDMTVDEIKNRVKVKSQGDLLLVTAIAGDPELAAEIANTWAREAVDAINLAYSGEQPLSYRTPGGEANQKITVLKPPRNLFVITRSLN